PARERRLPWRVLLVARAVVRRRRGCGDPGRGSVRALSADPMRLRAMAVTAELVAIVAAGIATGLSEAASKPPARMLVYAQEWSLWPSRSAVPVGHVVVQLWNRGEDAH